MGNDGGESERTEREALALPGVRRLGHAISLIDDPELVRRAYEEWKRRRCRSE